MDIEQPHDLRTYLIEHGHLALGDPIDVTVLVGGVSNRTVLAQFSDGRAWVIKQALAKLRVKVDWFSDPARLHHEALAIGWLPSVTPPGTIPGFVFEDQANHLLAMQAIPQPHDNWKRVLLRGEVVRDHFTQFGRILGLIHRGAADRLAEVEPLFGDTRFYETLRLEPFYAYTGSQHAAATAFYVDLIAATRQHRLTLVHGDYSPKNILIHHGQLILLDHEVMHIGDPAFDVGFALAHLLSKANHLTSVRAALADCAGHCWHTYAAAIAGAAWASPLEARAVRHTLGCLLARVDGRSPVDYLTEPERAAQRRAVLALMAAPPATIPLMITAFIAALTEAA